jgi:hypothetical protein
LRRAGTASQHTVRDTESTRLKSMRDLDLSCRRSRLECGCLLNA